jgi:hypothetical protein
MPDTANGYFEDTDVDDTDEDIKFLMYVDADRGQRYIVRYERNGANQTTVLANRIDSLVFRYFDEKVTYEDSTLNAGATNLTVNTGGRTYSVQRVVADVLNTDNTAKNLKRITITVTPQAAGPNWTRTPVVLVSYRSTLASGSYLVSN